jgi:Ca2+:H+ antiporter
MQCPPLPDQKGFRKRLWRRGGRYTAGAATSELTCMPGWSLYVPVLALAAATASLVVHPVGAWLVAACVTALPGAVIAGVHHAEVIAHRIGEPLGTLVLSLAVTVIEVSLLVTVMLHGEGAEAALPRDAIFAVIMITLNGLVGLSVLIGALRHREQSFHVIGSNAALSTLIALAFLTLVLPGFTVSSPGLTYTTRQLLFASVVSVLLWAAFVFVQTVRHRDYFLPQSIAGEDVHAPIPTGAQALGSLSLLLASLVAVVGLAHELAPGIEAGVAAARLPRAVVSIAIALLTLLPEGWAAVRAALTDRLQNSLNLATGSALASIGLTIPAMAIISIPMGIPLVLGLAPKELVLLVVTFLVTSITLVAGRTHVLQGVVHLVILAAFLFFSMLP